MKRDEGLVNFLSKHA